MLDLRIIRETALEIPTKIDQLTLINGEKDITIALQVIDLYNGEPYIIPTGSTVNVYFESNIRDPIELAGTVYTNNRSIVTVILSETNINKIVNSYAKIKITDTTGKIKIAYKDNQIIKES